MTVSFKRFNKYNIAPYVSENIGVFDSEGNLVGKINAPDFKPEYGSRIYRFGLLTDIHQQTSQTTENMADFENALGVLDAKESVEFVCTCGDLTQNGCATTTEIAQYADVVSRKASNTPIYTTTGNHDCTQSGITLSNWLAYTNLDTTSKQLTFSDTQLSFYFEKPVAGTTKKDIFFFLGMKKWSFTSGTYYDEDITWLQTKLSEWGTDARVFIFTHMFFPQRAGNFMEVYPSGNWLSGTQLTALTNIANSYPKTIWFSGHSHWKWYLQGSDETQENYKSLYCNIWHEQNNTGWAVHIPSCASPIDSYYVNGAWTRESSTEYANKASEGAIVDVYDDYIDIRGVEFKEWTKTDQDAGYNLQYVPVATYRIPVSAGYLESDTDDPNIGNTYTIATTLNHSTASNTSASATYHDAYQNIITPDKWYEISDISLMMGGEDVSRFATLTDGICRINIPYITGDLTITVTTAKNADKQWLDKTIFLGGSANKNNTIATTANYARTPIEIWHDGDDRYTSITVTTPSQGFVFTNLDDPLLGANTASSLTITADEMKVYKIAYSSDGNVETEIDPTKVIGLGFYDVASGNYGTSSVSPFGYGLVVPFTNSNATTSNGGIRSIYNKVFEYDETHSGVDSTSPSTYTDGEAITVNGGNQFNTSSKFTQANNSSWWNSSETLVKNLTMNPIGSGKIAVKVVFKNLVVTGA